MIDGKKPARPTSRERYNYSEPNSIASHADPRPGQLRVLRWAFVLSLMVASQSCALAEDSPKFVDVVTQHFEKWVHGNKGILTPERVKELVLRRDIHGAEAAALASIHCYQRKAGTHAEEVTRSALLSDKRKEDPTLRRDEAASGANLSHNYKAFLKHLQTAPRQLFTKEHPSLEGIAQGHLGDCYFISGVGAAVHRDPEIVRRLIISRTDGSYEVRFRNGKHIHVPPLTDAELALGSSAGHQGIWLNVLEVAAGTVEVEAQKKKSAELVVLDTLGEGGDSVFTIELLTGHKAQKDLIRPHQKGARPAPAERDVPQLADKITQHIRDALHHQRLVCCGVGRWTVPPGMGQWHQYAVLGINHGHVDLWNPWGSNYKFEPKSEPGLKHGYHTVGGKFSMPIQDFVRVFGAVNCETENLLK